MSLLESVIETKVVQYAEEKGCIHLKLNVFGRRGWPDRIFIYPGPRVMFIEFKRLGEKPRKLQEYIHARLRHFGCRVEVVDTELEGRATVDDFTSRSANI